MPWRCSTCGHENMVDMERLSSWPIDKILTVRGFTCSCCGKREAILYTNTSLDEAVRKLVQYPPSHRQFAFLLAKCLRRAEALRLRGETDGKVRSKNLASA